MAGSAINFLNCAEGGESVRGEYTHSIDAKGRLFMPAKLRDTLGTSFIVTKGLDGCLFVYSASAWAELEAKISQLPISKSRQLQRFFFSSASDCTPDSQGRVVIAPNLREYSGLTKDVTVIGVSGRVEIWDTKKWQEYNSELTSDSIEEAMEQLGF